MFQICVRSSQKGEKKENAHVNDFFPSNMSKDTWPRYLVLLIYLLSIHDLSSSNFVSLKLSLMYFMCNIACNLV